MNSRQRRKIAAIEHNEFRELVAEYSSLRIKLQAKSPMVPIYKLINPSADNLRSEIKRINNSLNTDER